MSLWREAVFVRGQNRVTSLFLFLSELISWWFRVISQTQCRQQGFGVRLSAFKSTLCTKEEEHLGKLLNLSEPWFPSLPSFLLPFFLSLSFLSLFSFLSFSFSILFSSFPLSFFPSFLSSFHPSVSFAPKSITLISWTGLLWRINETLLSSVTVTIDNGIYYYIHYC